jgi:hypothetical protein
MSLQPVLLRAQVDGFSLAAANELVIRWAHDLGPCNRPYGSDCWTFDIEGEPVAVAISASIVSPVAAGFTCRQVVELARLCSANDWANRLMLRWWREVGARRWPYWEPRAAVSYSNRGKTGDLYRFDGWQLVDENCGDWRARTSRRGFQAPRHDGKAGGKKLWLWRYQ